MARLDLTLFGGFRARLDAGPPLVLPTRKAQALLAYLALPLGSVHPRDKVAALLWGDMRQPQARASLRQALTAIRRVLAGVDALRVDAETIALDPAAVAVDAVIFQQRVKSGTREALEQAVTLYQGDLLAGLTLNEAPFEEWLLSERESLHELALGASARLLAQQRAAGATDAAVQSALRLLALDPLQEPVHRALMGLYMQLGRRGAALRQYQVCVAALERELRTEPESETKALYQDILRRQPPPVGEPPVTTPAETSSAPAPASRPIAAVPETTVVGRESELAILGDALEQSLAGAGRLIALLGEAGIGKSRLAAEIATTAVGRGSQVMMGRCYQTEQALPFAPWVDALRSARVTDNDALVTGLAPVWRAELARLLPEVGVGASPVRLDADPRSLFEAVVEVLHHLAAERPLVVMFEDLHWADEMSLRLLAFAGRRLAGRRTLLIATARDEDLSLAPLLGQTLGELERDQRLVCMRLAPLSRQDTMALTSRLVESRLMAAERAAIEEQVWRASEGNPFVAVETVRALRHERGSPGDHSLLPSRVHDLIAQRLARLGEPSRRLVAIAAVVGRQCDFSLLQRAADLPELEAARAVEELVRHRVLHQSGDGFEFTHDRIREVAHADLLAPHRLILHRRIAESLEAPGAGSRPPDALALGAHYRAAGVWDKAARYLKEAGHAAWSRRAPAEGAACFEQALDALGRLAESRQTREEVFEIHFALARVVYGLGDFSRALHHYRAAEDLARALGDDRRLSQVLGGMLYLLPSEGLHGEASEMGERALALARALDDLTLQAWAGVGLGRAYFALGQYRLGIERTRWLVALDSRTSLDASAQPAMLRPSVGSRTWLALCLARIGEYGDALSASEDAIRAAERADNAQARVWAYYTLAHIHLTRGEPAPALALLERALALCRNGEEPLYYPRVLGALGSAHALEGRADQAVELLEHAAAESRVIRLLYGYAGLVTSLGEACLGAGHFDEARRLAAEAVALTRERGERGDEGWALRLTAEIAERREPPRVAEATTAYRQALAIAEELEMRPLAARCRLGLGVLFSNAGEILAARAQLARASELFAALGISRWQAEADSLLAEIAR